MFASQSVYVCKPQQLKLDASRSVVLAERRNCVNLGAVAEAKKRGHNWRQGERGQPFLSYLLRRHN